MSDEKAHITIEDVTMAYGDFVVMRDLNIEIKRAEIFVIMGGSGCGKSTLLKHMIGLLQPAKGRILYDGEDFTHASEEKRQGMLKSFGVTYQNAALWSSMTLAENIALPLQQHTDYSREQIEELVRFKLSLVGLKGFEDFYPAQISGGMRKRAGLARSLALDPEILFFDEPSAGLDPISSRRLDDLILELRDGLGATIIMVTHELPSIMDVADNAVFLDTNTRTATAQGNPRKLKDESTDPYVLQFLNRLATAEEGKELSDQRKQETHNLFFP